MTEAVAKHIKKLHQLEKKGDLLICRFVDLSISQFVDLSMRRLKKNKKHCFKTLLKADKTVFFCVSSDEIFCI